MVTNVMMHDGTFLTFALVGGVGGQGVAIETLLAAVAEEAVGVVDALETFSGLAVAVANGVGVDVVAALAGAARSNWAALTQRVPEESVVTELAAFTCRQVNTGGTMKKPAHLSDSCCTPSSSDHAPSDSQYLWFQQDSWCRPLLPFWGPQRMWLRPDTGTACSLPTSPGWRRHRIRPYSARSSVRPCDADSCRLLDDKQSDSRSGSVLSET